MAAPHRPAPLFEQQGLNGEGPHPSRHLLPAEVPGGLAFWPRGEVAMVREEWGTDRLEVLHASGLLGHRPGPLAAVEGPPWVRVADDALVHPAHVLDHPATVPPVGPEPTHGQSVLALPGGWGVVGRARPPAPEPEPPEEELPGLGVRPQEVRRLEAGRRRSTWHTDRGEIRGKDFRGNHEARRHPHMVKAGHGLYVNARRIRRVGNPPGEKFFVLEMDDGYQARLGQTGLSPMWRGLAEDLGLPQLYFLEPRSERARLFDQEGLRDWPRLLADTDPDVLRREFHGDPRLLIGNAVVQVARARASGRPVEFGTEHRMMWYLLIELLLYRAGMLHQGDPIELPPGELPDLEEDPARLLDRLAALEPFFARDRKSALYALYEGILTTYVGEYGFFDYRGLGFADPRPELRFLGDRHPEVVLVAEKSGLAWAVLELVRLFGCSAIILGGQPSYLAVEFFAEALRPRLQGRPIHQVDYCDHDPGGWFIGKSFTRHLGRYGLEVARHSRLIRPERFTEEEIRLYALPLEATNEAIRQRILTWIRETGGIGGKGLGLHADLLRPLARVIQAMIEETGLQPRRPRS